MQPENAYRPGDIVNGYRLNAYGTDWEPVDRTVHVPGDAPAPKKRHRGRKAAAGVVGALVALFTMAGIAGGGDGSAVAQDSEASDRATTEQSDQNPAPAQQPKADQREAASQTVTVTGIVDGDTIETAAGTVRVIGIDTPERGQCGYEEATANAAKIVGTGSTVTLTPVSGMDDTDRYGRSLRYVTTSSGTDLGTAQIASGFAIARYDSRDGYGSHPKESAYISADLASPPFECPVAASVPAQTVDTPAPTVEAPAPQAPASVHFANCTAARAAGAAPLHIGDPGYSTKLDRDRDGIACE